MKAKNKRVAGEPTPNEKESIMSGFRNLSIKNKLTLLILTVASIVTISGFALLIAERVESYKSELKSSTVLAARLLGEFCVTPLAFDDADNARLFLSRAQSVRAIRGAYVYTPSGDLFAHFRKDSGIAPPPAPAADTVLQFKNKRLHVVQPIIYENQRYGRIAIEASTAELAAKINGYAAMLGALLGCLILLAWALATRAQMLISRPILALASTMVRVSREHDFSLRVHKPGRDEVGLLYDEFNTMLEQIQIAKAAREQAARELEAEEARIRTLLETVPLGVLECDINGRILAANRACAGIAEVSLDMVLSTTLEKFLPVSEPRKLNLVAKMRETTYAGNTPAAIIFTTVINAGRKKQVQVDWKNKLNSQGVTTGFVCVVSDITERRMLEEQLRQSEKLQAIGQLAGGVAHDFNNQLAGIVGFAQLLEKEAAHTPSIADSVEAILLGARRASDLTAQLLAFARKGKYLSEPVSIHKAIDEVAAILERSIDRKIRVCCDFCAEDLFATGDPTQLQNALLNLGLNARDAMPAGGKLIFSTSKYSVHKKYTTRYSFTIVPGTYVRISVRDTGAGMSEEIQRQLFEPFFTTKEPGKGTGMGLAAVYGTAKNHKGAVEVETAPGKGSVFHLLLPKSEISSRKLPDRASLKTARSGGRLMLVDDEELIRKMGKRVFEELGYSVILCANGKEAVERYTEQWKEIDLVLLDMVMPEMDGGETFVALRKINAGIQALLFSGYSMDGTARLMNEAGVVGFFQKPYDIMEVANKIAEILDRPKTSINST